jgi:hypothetical protein
LRADRLQARNWISRSKFGGRRWRRSRTTPPGWKPPLRGCGPTFVASAILYAASLHNPLRAAGDKLLIPAVVVLIRGLRSAKAPDATAL